MGKTKTALISAKETRNKESKKKSVEENSMDEVSMTAEDKKATLKAPKVRGKKYQEAKEKISVGTLYKPDEAIKLAKEVSTSSFDGSIEFHAVVKKASLSVSLEYPNSFGKARRIEIASDKTIENLKKSVVDFDVLLATPDMMPKLVPFARILGPKGLMPNPKNGTIIKNAAAAKSFSGAKVTIKTQKDFPVIHTVIGKSSMDDKKIKENLDTLINTIGPKQIVKAYLTPTMGPSVKLQI